MLNMSQLALSHPLPKLLRAKLRFKGNKISGDPNVRLRNVWKLSEASVIQ